jgi:hypothetical protein
VRSGLCADPTSTRQGKRARFWRGLHFVAYRMSYGFLKWATAGGAFTGNHRPSTRAHANAEALGERVVCLPPQTDQQAHCGVRARPPESPSRANVGRHYLVRASFLLRDQAGRRRGLAGNGQRFAIGEEGVSPMASCSTTTPTCPQSFVTGRQPCGQGDGRAVNACPPVTGGAHVPWSRPHQQAPWSPAPEQQDDCGAPRSQQ